MADNKKRCCPAPKLVLPKRIYRARRKHRLTKKDFECMCGQEGDYMPTPPNIPELVGVPLVVIDRTWTPVDILPLPPEPTTEEEKTRLWAAQQIGPGIEDFSWVTIEASLRPKYTHEQATAELAWTIQHDTNTLLPRVVLFNAGKRSITGVVDNSMTNENTIVIRFARAVAGRAYITGD